jgi:hypothetical protein
MDFKDQVKQLASRAETLLPEIQTEEATKNALIMPFIQTLGYDVFNPFEVTPEFVADLGIKKGEKVDYAILKDKHPIILIECKHHKEKLDPHNSQLFRYFHTTKAKFSLLSNGLDYRFYTDLVEPNKMDEKPFFEFRISDMKDNEIEELKKFHKSYFDVAIIFDTASELKYTSAIKALMAQELKAPSDNFTRHFVSQVYPNKITANVLTKFTEVVKKSGHQLINDIIGEKLKTAFDQEDIVKPVETTRIEATLPDPIEESKIITTEEEKEGFLIVKAIVRQKVDISRVFSRDTQSYFGILLDDNNRKPICRLHLNGKTKKYIELFDNERKGTSYEIKSIDSIYDYADKLIEVVGYYL